MFLIFWFDENVKTLYFCTFTKGGKECPCEGFNAYRDYNITSQKHEIENHNNWEAD